MREALLADRPLDADPDHRLDPGPTADDEGDRQLALWMLFELHHRGFEDVPDDAEWRPDLLALRRDLERDLEARWRELAAPLLAEHAAQATGDLATDFFALCEADTGPSVAEFVRRRATTEQLHAVLRQRSVYHGKEQDAAMWAVPRLDDEPTAHLLAVAYDEYGNGSPDQVHSRLWAGGLRAAGVDDAYGAHVGEAVPEVLEQNNLMAMLGLQRRLLPASLGHLAAFEVTSALPSQQWVRGLERLRAPEELTGYFREHVLADSVHEQVAVRQLLGSYLGGAPDRRDDVFWGGAVCLLAEGRAGAAVLRAVGADEHEVAA
ncbi:iron-containing redox enzyme family protein [Nocardioides nanhaiensis]|uniref:Iron-containing redox enzyme family protein n=1 Tax=Nocardioides nanhaiensis TaxID=1476871 RepID=A0ABP8WFI7_9ACTN